MTRNILLVALFSLGTVGFTACDGGDDPTEDTDVDTEAPTDDTDA